MVDHVSFTLGWILTHNIGVTDRPICQEPGCDRSSIECELMDNDGIHHEYFCNEHAAVQGFCMCCGIFIAGWIDNDNMCENCRDQTKINDPDEDEGEEDYPDNPY